MYKFSEIYKFIIFRLTGLKEIIIEKIEAEAMRKGVIVNV